MRRILITLALAAILLPMPSPAQEPAITVQAFGPAEQAAAESITINGPATAKSGDVVSCTLAGTPPVDLAKPLVDQLDWLVGDDRMFVYVAMPKQAMVPLDVEGTIVFSPQGATMRPQIHFGVSDPGEYRLVVDWNYGQNQLVEHVVTVEGDKPNPFPKPDPEPGPIPAGTRVVMVLSESSDRTPSEVEVETSLRRQLASLLPPPHYQLLDPDTPSVNNWADPYKAEVQAKQVALPALVVAVLPSNGVPVFVGVKPLPATSAEAFAYVKEVLAL
jgi:hypothetical protein